MRYTKRNFRRYPARRLKKRWYFNAGANLPFVGKTNVSFGSGPSKSKRSLINVVRNGLEDPLHKLYSKVGTAPPITNLLQNTIYSLNLNSNIPQGTTDNSRVGDTIHLEALKYTFSVYTTNATNVNIPKEFRIMIVKSDVDGGSASDAFGSYIGATDIFFGNNQVVHEKVNPKLCTVLYDNRIKMTPQITGVGQISTVEGVVPLHTKFLYKSGTNYGKYANYYVAIMGFEPNATTGTTTIGGVQFFGDLIFKDCK